MFVKRRVVGPVSTNCYLVASDSTREAMVIDPDLRDEREVALVLDDIQDNSFKVKYIVNTHGHNDHIGGNEILKKKTGADILVHHSDESVLPVPWKRLVEAQPEPWCFVCGERDPGVDVAPDMKSAQVSCARCGFSFQFMVSPPADRLLHDGDTVCVGEMDFKVIHTPGHSPGQICLYSESERVLFTGDTLFQGSIGRTDLPGSSDEEMARSLAKLAGMPDDVTVYPGHGEPTTMGAEKRFNPYLVTGINF